MSDDLVVTVEFLRCVAPGIVRRTGFRTALAPADEGMVEYRAVERHHLGGAFIVRPLPPRTPDEPCR